VYKRVNLKPTNHNIYIYIYIYYIYIYTHTHTYKINIYKIQRINMHLKQTTLNSIIGYTPMMSDSPEVCTCGGSQPL